jgi:hypothetical protein
MKIWIGAGAVFVCCVGLVGGWAGMLHALVFAAATAPGLPLGFALFGRRHAAGWVAGGLMGYALTCVVLALAIKAGASSPLAIGVIWLLFTGAMWAVRMSREPVVPLPVWTRRDSIALLCVLLVVPLLTVPAFRHIGTTDADGNRLYRAYFTADFVWHEALITELGRFQLPPANPYLSGETLHYYWTYFMVPAVSTAVFRSGVQYGGEAILLANAMCAGTLFVAILFIFTWVVMPRRWAAGGAVVLAVLAASFEGTWTLWRLWRTNGPLSVVLDLNIDAMTMWQLRGLTIDGLPRSLWYVPQHAGACALGLIALTVAVGSPRKATIKSALLAGVALALAMCFSPFPGGLIAVVYGIGYILAVIESPRLWLRTLAPQLITVAVAACGVVWCLVNSMVEGAGGALQIGLLGNARHEPVATILLALGPLLAPAAGGLLLAWKTPAWRVAAAGLLIGVPTFFFFSVAGDGVWVGWRAGQIMLVTLPALAAVGLGWLADLEPRHRIVAAAWALLMIAGLPTTAIDAYNAQDVTNRRMGAGFHWTVVLTPDQQAAFRWIQRRTPSRAIVQADPIVRERETWTHIPTFAQRRTAGGLPISLLANQVYDDRCAVVHQMFATLSAREAWELALKLGIDYIYLDQIEREGLPAGAVEKFVGAPEYFPPVFDQGPVLVLAVAKP